MNVITVVSVIILPLSPIPVLYGMNFQAYEPVGKVVHFCNMPELYTPGGYWGVLALMSFIVLAQVVYFRRKDLLGRSKSR